MIKLKWVKRLEKWYKVFKKDWIDDGYLHEKLIYSDIKFFVQNELDRQLDEVKDMIIKGGGKDVFLRKLEEMRKS